MGQVVAYSGGSADDGYFQLLKEETRTARKTHRCCECRRTIRVGEKYKIEATVFDGDFWEYKTCPHCLKTRGYISPFFYTCLHQDISDSATICAANDSDSRRDRLLLTGLSKQWTRADGSLFPIPHP